MFAKIVGTLRSPPEFFRKASLSFLMRFGGLFVQFLGAVLVARLLGAEEFGAFTYAATWATFVGALLALGLGELSIRELPHYLYKGDRAAILGYLLTVGLTIALTGIATTVIFSILERAEILVLAPGWILVAMFAIIHALVLSVSNVLNGFQRILTSQFLETILRSVVYLSLILAFLFAGFTFSPTRMFEISLLAAVPILLVMLWVLARAWATAGSGRVRPAFQARIWIAGALPLLLTVFANRLQLDLDVLMVGALLGDIEVGIYRAAARAAILVTIANMIAIQLVGPMLSRSLAKGDKEETQTLLSQAALVSFLLGVPICLIFGFGANIYLGLYGPEFPEASTSLQLLLVGQATIVLAGADATLLVMLRRERLVLIVTAIGVVMNFLLNLTLITPLGIEGAAIASLVSMAFVRTTLVVAILRGTGFDTTVFQLIPRFFGRSFK